VTPLVVILATAGAIWGLAADRIGARWPAHEDGSVRGVDWRTVVTVVAGILALGGVARRFDEPSSLLIFGIEAAALVLLLATDLDQRLLPDEVTLPLIPFAAAVVLLGLDPFVPPGELPLAILAAVGIPGVLLALSIPFGTGAFGLGDVKLLVSVGLLLGLQRAIGSIVAGVLLGGLVIGLLVIARRITLRSYVPFGPFIILGTLWGILVLP
jgi:leader peptidase (prepilin peptidase)/N-methyltransferase